MSRVFGLARWDTPTANDVANSARMASVTGVRALTSVHKAESRPRVLIVSYHFWPSIGGMEAVARLLAERILQAGYSVSVVTDTVGEGEDGLAYPVVRRPPPMALWQAIQRAELIVVNHPSLRVAWPLLLQRKPFVLITHTWSSFSGPSGAFRRLLFQRAAVCLAISKAIERHFPVRGRILPSPYDERVFFPDEAIPKTADLLFVGRMVSDKGALDLVRALNLLRANGLQPSVSFVGDGPERPMVESLIRKLEMDSQVRQYGSCTPHQVAALMRQHRILVVPSVWEEPFGIVALEGIACGCVVIGSSGGGLPEAIGPCGLVYPNGSVPLLAEGIEALLRDPCLIERLRAAAADHLARRSGEAISAEYLELLREVWERS